ncbi:MAG: TetR/AcrR family transcriptional regulator [Solirubrobacterales bacterium]
MPSDRIHLSQEILASVVGEGWPPDQIDAAVEMLANGDGKFPSGVRKLPSDLIRTLQRERLVAAMLNAAAELGYREANVQDVIERAGVSRPTFYEHFTNKEDCFLAAFDTSTVRLRKKVAAAARKGGGVWRDRTRYGLEALLHFMAAEPDTARTLVVEARGASPDAALRRVALLDHFTGCLENQASELLTDPPSNPVTASAIVGGIESLLYSRLCKGEIEEIEDLLPSLMYFVVLPYEGHTAAGEELAVG